MCWVSDVFDALRPASIRHAPAEVSITTLASGTFADVPDADAFRESEDLMARRGAAGWRRKNMGFIRLIYANDRKQNGHTGKYGQIREVDRNKYIAIQGVRPSLWQICEVYRALQMYLHLCTPWGPTVLVSHSLYKKLTFGNGWVTVRF